MSEREIGQNLCIIYQDVKGTITKRTIRVIKVGSAKLYAYDYGKRAMRPFKLDRILAYQRVGRTA